MAKLSQSQVISALESAGMTPDNATTLAAIAGAETGGTYDPSVLGDVNLENATWGPSVGIFQIRTLKAQTGTGSSRDLAHLQGNIGAQIAAAIQISSTGRNFSPWTTYTDGAYRKYLPSGTAAGGGTTDVSLPSKVLGGITEPLVDGARNIAYVSAFAALGLALIGAGAYKAFGPRIRGAAGTALKVAAL